MSSRFDFLHVNQDFDMFGTREAIIDGFLLERSINMLYAKAGTGKTWLCFSISKLLASKGYDVLYLDPDNGIDIIKERGFDRHIDTTPKLEYINGDLMDEAIEEFAAINESILKNADNGYDKAVFIYDGVSFFLGGGMYDETKLNRLISVWKKIRKAGGTVIAINHTTKKGDAMKGGGTLINALDEVWKTEKINEQDKNLHFMLTPEKYRMDVKETGLSVNMESLELCALDNDIALMSESELELVEKIKTLLQTPLSQGELMSGLEKAKADKTMLAFLAKFEGKFWQVEKKSRQKIYNLL